MARTSDERFMDLALALARRGLGATHPNPVVGAVVVRRGEIVGRGWHARAGGPHAEVVALAAAGSRARGATLYVTLEPCCHTGRTPPCTDAVRAAGIARVVAAMRDPNPLVDGKGLALLRRRGVSVAAGCREAAARELNAGFVKRVTTSMPLVTLKAALTLDGRIATSSGESKWITGPEARRHVQSLRAQSDAIAVGVGTVLADDPRLSARDGSARRPVRVVFDTELRTPPAARALAGARAGGGGVLILAAPDAPRARRTRLERAGARVIAVPRAARGGVSLRRALRALARVGLNTLLLEGGGRLATAFLADRLVDRVALFYALVILGGAKPLVGDLGIARLAGAIHLRDTTCRRIGGDLLIEGRL
ncbi:MAG: bifunctional diaminohydroxyphosphoribosylaminopyrimidine deaminase/5-amino-6-(5-phosphoribosylamino)uracil reductase RibD [bacterium]